MQFRSPAPSEPVSSRLSESASCTNPLKTGERGEDKEEKDGKLRTIEFHSSRAPQPFLDGEAVLASMRALRDGRGGEMG